MTFSHPKLLAAIQKSCPELMELTFGCEIQIKSFAITYKVAQKVQGKPIKYLSVPANNQQYSEFIAREDDFEIIGIEPQLHHVLRAMDEKNTNFLVDLAGVFWGQLFVGDEEIPPAPSEVQWNLSHGLYSQPTNVLDFLESLLVTK